MKWPLDGVHLGARVSRHAAERYAERIGGTGVASALARAALARLDFGGTVALYLDRLTGAAFVVHQKAGGAPVVATVVFGLPARGTPVAGGG